MYHPYSLSILGTKVIPRTRALNKKILLLRRHSQLVENRLKEEGEAVNRIRHGEFEGFSKGLFLRKILVALGAHGFVA